jgi:hypothetical protein
MDSRANRTVAADDAGGAARTARVWLAGCVAATTLLALASNGAYHDDDLKHYLFARWVCHDAAYLIDTWGRPGFTVLYALPAQAGWWACRLVSVAASAVTAWAAFASARRLGLRRAAWTVPLIYAQPLFLYLASTTLTETAAAMYLALATWALLAKRGRLSALAFSMTLITRHESVVLLPIWAWALWRNDASRRRRFAAWVLLLWAPAAYYAIAWAGWGATPWTVFARPNGATHYGRGTALTFVMRWIVFAGPVVGSLAVVGFWRLWSHRRARPLVAGTVLFVVAETVLYMAQAYATGGYARFLVPLAPWVGIAAVAGANGVIGEGKTRRGWVAVAAALMLLCEIEHALNPIEWIEPWWWALRLAGLLFLGGVAATLIPKARTVGVAIVALGLMGPLVGRAAWPHQLRPRERALARTVEALRRRNWLDRPLYTTNDWVHYFAGTWYPARRRPLHERLAHAVPGALFIWERRYGDSPDFGLSLAALQADPRWREVLRVEPAPETPPSAVVLERAGRPHAGTDAPRTNPTRSNSASDTPAATRP